MTAWLGARSGLAALLRSGCLSGFDRIRELFVIPKLDLVLVGAFTLIAGVLGVLHLDQQMRLDEASSFAMYASASPLVSLLTYDTPNNHILHSTVDVAKRIALRALRDSQLVFLRLLSRC